MEIRQVSLMPTDQSCHPRCYREGLSAALTKHFYAALPFRPDDAQRKRVKATYLDPGERHRSDFETDRLRHATSSFSSERHSKKEEGQGLGVRGKTLKKRPPQPTNLVILGANIPEHAP